MKIFDLTFFGLHIAPSYYGLAYALGFILGFYFLKKRKFLSEIELENLMIYIFLGVILGGRIGYILFYNLHFYIANPSEIIAFWHGGMSFHGGAIGVIAAILIFAKKYRKSFFDVGDNIVCALPIGLFLGRIGNYLNGELFGKNNFPSPLLEAFLEGIVLFFLLNFLYRKRRFHGQIGGYFLLFYGIFRFLAEFIRLPDPQIGYILGWLTMGQILSFPMILVGIYLAYFFKKIPTDAK